MERAIHSDGHQGSWSSWHLNSALKVEKDGIQGADRMADAKTQRHEETPCISGMVTLPRPSLLILANAGPTSYSEGTPPISVQGPGLTHPRVCVHSPCLSCIGLMPLCCLRGMSTFCQGYLWF